MTILPNKNFRERAHVKQDYGTFDISGQLFQYASTPQQSKLNRTVFQTKPGNTLNTYSVPL